MRSELQSDQDGSERSVKTGLIRAYSRLMRPLVRILIRNGLAFNEFAETLKAIYVDVAAKDFALPDRRQSGTRIAILTGLTRKDVKRLIELRESAEGKSDSSDLNRVTRVLVGWHQDSDFTGPYGVPLDLKFDSRDQDELSFTELVRRYSGDMSPRAMLDELIRVSAVEILVDGSISAQTRYYIPNQMDPASLDRFGTVIANLAETLDYNMQKTEQGKGRFERTVLAEEGIDPEALAAFNILIRERGQLFLETLDNFLNEHRVEGNEVGNKKPVKTGVGIFHFIE